MKQVTNKPDLIVLQGLDADFDGPQTNIQHLDNITYILRFDQRDGVLDAVGTLNVEVTIANNGKPESTWNWVTTPVIDQVSGSIITDIPVGSPWDDMIVNLTMANYSNVRLTYTAGSGDGYISASLNAKSLS